MTVRQLQRQAQEQASASRPPQVDTPYICAVLGAAVVAAYLLKLVTLVQMKRMEQLRRQALNVLKHQKREVTPDSEVHSVPVTPDTPRMKKGNDDWDVQDY